MRFCSFLFFVGTVGSRGSLSVPFCASALETSTSQETTSTTGLLYSNFKVHRPQPLTCWQAVLWIVRVCAVMVSMSLGLLNWSTASVGSTIRGSNPGYLHSKEVSCTTRRMVPSALLDPMTFACGKPWCSPAGVLRSSRNNSYASLLTTSTTNPPYPPPRELHSNEAPRP